MTLPVKARVRATPNFASNLQEVGSFFVEQDADSAARRMQDVRDQLSEMRNILRWSPGRGRPARFMVSRSAQGQLKLAALLLLARQSGMPELREYIVGSFVVLYAHSESEVLLLALKHERQFTYRTAH